MLKSLHNYLAIVGGRIVGDIHFSRALALSEMHTDNSGFEFWLFFLLNWLPYQGYRTSLPFYLAKAVCICQPLHMIQDQFHTRSLNSEFSFSKPGCHTKVKEPNLPNNFTYCRRINSWIHTFPRELVLCEMPIDSSRIWTWLAVSISDNGNQSTTGTSP